MIRFILKELEKTPGPVFSKKELVDISRTGFEDLLKRRILVYLRPSEKETENLRLPRCQHGCNLTVVRIDGELEAVCLDHPEKDPIPIDKDDLSRYSFSVDRFLFKVRTANGIEGEFQRIEGGYFHLGHKFYNDMRVGFAFVPAVQDEWLVRLSGLKNLSTEDEILVVLSPSTLIDEITLKNALLNKRIIQVSLAESMNPKTFVMPLRKHLSGVLQSVSAETSSIIEMTGDQREDYERHKYRCADRLHIPGEITAEGKNVISLNGNQITIEVANLILLLRFVVGLKRDKDGWVDRYSLHEERIISDPDRFQHYSRLRRELAPNLLLKDGKDFIQNDLRKRYRISTHPDFVTYDKEKLLEHANYRVVKIAERLP